MIWPELLPERLVMLPEHGPQGIADPVRAHPLAGPEDQQRRQHLLPAHPSSLGDDRKPRPDLRGPGTPPRATGAAWVSTARRASTSAPTSPLPPAACIKSPPQDLARASCAVPLSGYASGNRPLSCPDST